MRTAGASLPGRLGASLLAVILCALMVMPAQAITANTHFTPAVPVPEKTAYRGVFGAEAQAYTGLFGADNPVDRIDPSGHDGELISTMAAVGLLEYSRRKRQAQQLKLRVRRKSKLIEAETAEQVSMAQAELQQAFQSSGAAVESVSNIRTAC